MHPGIRRGGGPGDVLGHPLKLEWLYRIGEGNLEPRVKSSPSDAVYFLNVSSCLVALEAISLVQLSSCLLFSLLNEAFDHN